MLFPPEIFDLIIDAAAAERRVSTLMKTCSLVCHNFHARARIHLFSHICLYVGMYGQSYRAKKFLRILKYKKNSDLISHCIRSVKILIFSSQYYDEAEPIFRLVLQGMGVCKHPIQTVLAKFKNAPIKELILRAVVYRDFRRFRKFSGLMLEMCLNPNLKTLCLENIRNFPLRSIEGNRTVEVLVGD